MPLGRHARNRYALSSAIFRRLIAIGPSQVRPYCLSMAPKGVPKAVAKPKAKAVAKPKARAKAGVRRERYRYAVAQRVRQNRVPEVLDQLGRLYRNTGGMPRYFQSLNWNGGHDQTGGWFSRAGMQPPGANLLGDDDALLPPRAQVLRGHPRVQPHHGCRVRYHAQRRWTFEHQPPRRLGSHAQRRGCRPRVRSIVCCRPRVRSIGFSTQTDQHAVIRQML